MSDAPPKAFISYSWTSTDHAAWVLRLAEELVANGVEVVLDKWHLREGHDANAFMEQMVTDPTVDKVVIISDRRYAERADGRAGGVGTETQIISPKIYEKRDQNKFALVVTELDAEGKPYVPTYYSSRIHIDLSNPAQYATNFEQLLRWIFDKPAYVRPPLGKPPSFLNDSAPRLATHIHSVRAMDALRSGATSATGALQEYLGVFGREIERFRVQGVVGTPFDDLVVENLSNFLPYRNEFVGVVSTLSTYADATPNGAQALHRFFEKALSYRFRPVGDVDWREQQSDNFKFIAYELFLYTVAILLRDECFSVAASLLQARYYTGGKDESGSGAMSDYSIFYEYMPTFAEDRKRRLGSQRLSLETDLLLERVDTSGVEERHLMQADFVLFLVDCMEVHKAQRSARWYPRTLSHLKHRTQPFEIFARSESRLYFAGVLSLFGMPTGQEFVRMLNRFEDGSFPPLNFGYTHLSPGQLANVASLASRP